MRLAKEIGKLVPPLRCLNWRLAGSYLIPACLSPCSQHPLASVRQSAEALHGAAKEFRRKTGAQHELCKVAACDGPLGSALKGSCTCNMCLHAQRSGSNSDSSSYMHCQKPLQPLLMSIPHGHARWRPLAGRPFVLVIDSADRLSRRCCLPSHRFNPSHGVLVA